MSKRSALLAVLVVLPCTVTAQDRPVQVQYEIQTEVTRMLHGVDALDWRVVRAAFTPDVRIDYTSLFGGNPESLAVDSLIGRWQRQLPGFEATQHQIGPVVITRHDGNQATAETLARGYHYIAGAEGGPMWMAAGRYRFAMERRAGAWKIAGITFLLAYQEGNLSFPQIAQTRVAAGLARRP